MNDLDALLVQVLKQAREIQIPVSSRIDTRVAVNRRAVSRLGCCIRTEKGYRIELAAGLLHAEERACLQTLAHEILHTCPGCRDHGPLWREYAARMNASYGYCISRTGSMSALGVAPPRKALYLLVCSACGQRFERYRASALVKYPERYRCACGGKLKQISQS